MDDSRFEGFSPRVFDFFRELAQNNHKDWLDQHRAEYELRVLRTIKRFAADLGQTMEALNPELETEPRVGKTISRITNDLRFARRDPYRPFISITYRVKGQSPAQPRLYAVISAGGVTLGFYPGRHRSSREGPVQASISRHLGRFEQYLVDRNISEKYWELADGGAGQLKKWPLPKTARRWIDLESFTVGESFHPGERLVSTRQFIHRAQTILLDLYPLWLFATSEDLGRDLDLYAESLKALSRPATRFTRRSDDRRKLGPGQRKSTTGSLRGLR